MKSIAYDGTAARQLRKLDREVARQITAKLRAYATDGTGDVTPIKGAQNTFRLRVRDWRVLFTDEAGEIAVLAVGHRREIYD